MTKPKIDQIALIAAITAELGRQHKCLMVADCDFNQIIKAANLICEAFNKKGLPDD